MTARLAYSLSEPARSRGVCGLWDLQSDFLLPSFREVPQRAPSWLKLRCDWLTQSESSWLHNSWNYSVPQPPSWCQVKSCCAYECVWVYVWQTQLTLRTRKSVYIEELLWLVGFSSLWGQLESAREIIQPNFHNIIFALLQSITCYLGQQRHHLIGNFFLCCIKFRNVPESRLCYSEEEGSGRKACLWQNCLRLYVLSLYSRLVFVVQDS